MFARKSKLQTLPYGDLGAALATLDRRGTDYQFELEALPWARATDPGAYAPRELLRDLGFEVDALAREPGAMDMFQWAHALLLCEGFAALEQQVIDFFDWEQRLLRHRSNDLLCEEERKHIEMFNRVADALRAQRPEWTYTFDRIFLETGCGDTAFDAVPNVTSLASHLSFWLGLVYFEEVTIYVHKRLSHSADAIQPLWRAVHHAHAREEVQHLLTDMAHAEGAIAPASDWAQATDMLEALIFREPDRTFGTRIARRMVNDAFPGLALGPHSPFVETPVYRDIVERDPLFRRTRQLLARGRAQQEVAR